jgi:phosphoenolpyruvate carboxylase
MHSFDEYSRINEAKNYSKEKMEWIRERIGDWIADEIETNKTLLDRFTANKQLRTFLQSKNIRSNDPKETLVAAIRAGLGKFLNQIGHLPAFETLKDLQEHSDTLAQKISRFGKPEEPGKRGRKPGSKNKPKEDPEFANLVAKVEAKKRLFELGGESDSWVRTRGGRGRDQSTETVSQLRQRIRNAEIEIEEAQAEIRSLENKLALAKSGVESSRKTIESHMEQIDAMYDSFYSDMASSLGISKDQIDQVRSQIESGDE